MMNLRMNPSCASGLKSKCQIVRRVTEAWASANMFCASCDSDRVEATSHNTKAVDFTCPDCKAAFQLKAGQRWSERKVPDAGYDAMMQALASDSIPNLLVMQYEPNWCIRNLLVIPSFFFSSVAIEKRKPLGPSARRAGWVGCNILLSQIADIGKIRIVRDGEATDASTVRKRYASLRPLAKLDVDVRGWTLHVLRVIRGLRQQAFSIRDVYEFAPELSSRYPKNRHIKPKIRQQLQVLRELGFVRFLGRGQYELSH